MANRKISELIEATSISGTDVLPIVNGGYTQKVKVDTLAEVTNEYTRANFLPLSGGSITNNLSVDQTFEVGTGLTVLFVSGSKVGINTETPNEALTIYGNISSTGDLYFNDDYKSIKTIATGTSGLTSVSTIVAVSALPISPNPSTLYIVV